MQYTVCDCSVEAGSLFDVAIQCDGASLPYFTDAESIVAHTGLFPYAATISYHCPTGHRFEDGNTNVVVTCAGIGIWDWNHILTSCERECRSYYTVSQI